MTAAGVGGDGLRRLIVGSVSTAASGCGVGRGVGLDEAKRERLRSLKRARDALSELQKRAGNAGPTSQYDVTLTFLVLLFASRGYSIISQTAAPPRRCYRGELGIPERGGL